MKKDTRRGLVLGASLLINLFVGSIYAWSVFAGSLEQLFGWSAAAVALTFTIANGISPVTMVTGGKLLDKYGPRWVVFCGGILFGGGMIASGFVHSVTAMYITYGLCVGFGLGMVYSCTIANTVKFFPDKKGLVSGLSTGAYGLSSVILAPLAQKLIDIFGVMRTFQILGIAVLVVIGCCSQVLRKAPEDNLNQDTELKQQDTGRDYTWSQMIRTVDFYLLLIMLTIGATAGLMMIGQASSMAQDLAGITAAQAALTVSLLSLANAGGRIIWGFISDRLGHYTVLPILFMILTVSMFSLFAAGGDIRILFFAAVALIGFCFGGFMAVFPAITSNRFGVRNNGVNYGIMFCGFAIGGLLGPRFAAMFRVTDLGLYSMAFIIAGIMSAVGIILAFVVKKRCDRKQTAQ